MAAVGVDVLGDLTLLDEVKSEWKKDIRQESM